jgi:hypothetical protein
MISPILTRFRVQGLGSHAWCVHMRVCVFLSLSLSLSLTHTHISNFVLVKEQTAQGIGEFGCQFNFGSNLIKFLQAGWV